MDCVVPQPNLQDPHVERAPIRLRRQRHNLLHIFKSLGMQIHMMMRFHLPIQSARGSDVR